MPPIVPKNEHNPNNNHISPPNLFLQLGQSSDVQKSHNSANVISASLPSKFIGLFSVNSFLQPHARIWSTTNWN